MIFLRSSRAQSENLSGFLNRIKKTDKVFVKTYEAIFGVEAFWEQLQRVEHLTFYNLFHQTSCNYPLHHFSVCLQRIRVIFLAFSFDLLHRGGFICELGEFLSSLLEMCQNIVKKLEQQART